jgi:creatinine amidohydrolase
MRMTRTIFSIGAAIVLGAMVVTAQPQQPQSSAPQAEQQRQRRPPDPRSRGGGDCRDNPYNCADTPNPLPAVSTVWLEEMTWMDVRDAMKAGKTTVIVSTGGIEPNGPWLALGKHNYVLRANCEAIARKLGNALCAPIIPLVPEGGIDPQTGHMTTVGTLSMREETFRSVLTDVASSLKMHGFQNVIFIGDSGGNQAGQKAVAEALTAQWNGTPVVAHIPEYYDYASVHTMLRQIDFMKEGAKVDNLHDDPGIALNMFITDPDSIRWAQRVKAGKATIDGASLADKAKNTEVAKKIVEFRATNTVAAIQKAIASKGRSTTNGNGTPAVASNPRFGRWKLKSDAPAPASNIMTYEPYNGGMKITIDAVNREGAASQWWYTTMFDGRDYPITGNPGADSGSVRPVTDRINEIIYKKDGKVTQVLTNVLSQDGDTIGVTYMRADASGKTTGVTFATYERIK